MDLKVDARSQPMQTKMLAFQNYKVGYKYGKLAKVLKIQL